MNCTNEHDEFLRRVYICLINGLLNQEDFMRLMAIAMDTSHREGFTLGVEVQQLRTA